MIEGRSGAARLQNLPTAYALNRVLYLAESIGCLMDGI